MRNNMRDGAHLQVRMGCLWVVLLLCSACGSSAPTATAAPTLTPAPLIATLPPDTRGFAIQDAQSVIRFAAVLTFGSIPINGTFGVKGKTLSVSQRANSTHVAIDLQIDGNNVISAAGLGIGTLKSMLETTKYPYAHLLAEADVPSLGATPTAATASGTLELHGQTRAVQLPVRLARSGDQVTASGQLTVELTDYKVVVPSLLQSKITIAAELVAQPEASTPVPKSERF